MAQVRLVDGKLVVNEESLYVTQAPATAYESMDIVNESGSFVTSATFQKRSSTKRWTIAETDIFYKASLMLTQALSVCGTDFSLIQRAFPDRSREQVKNKFKIEERIAPQKIDQYLKEKKPLNMSFFEECKRILEGEKLKKKDKPQKKKKKDNNNNKEGQSESDVPSETSVELPNETEPTPKKGRAARTRKLVELDTQRSSDLQKSVYAVRNDRDLKKSPRKHETIKVEPKPKTKIRSRLLTSNAAALEQ